MQDKGCKRKTTFIKSNENHFLLISFFYDFNQKSRLKRQLSFRFRNIDVLFHRQVILLY